MLRARSLAALSFALVSPAFFACAADDSGAGLGGGGGVGGYATGGTGGGTGGTGGSTGGTGGSTGGTGGSTGGTGATGGMAGMGGTAGASGAAGSGGSTTGGTGGTGGSTGGTGGSTGGTGGSTGGTGGSTGGTGGTTGGTGGTTGGTGGTGGSTDTTPPTVSSTTPASGASPVAKNATISVTFSEAMLTSSITTHTTQACSGSIQVSKDNFSSCEPMTAQPAATSGNTVFTLTPASPLASMGSYSIRVTTAAKDAAGNALAATYDLASPFVVRYHHTITIDGNNDFATNETFATSSSGYTGYVAWDEGYLYLGMSGADVGAASATKWLLAYFGGSPGTTTGVQYNTQQPLLPFTSRWHLRWRTDNAFTDAQVWGTSTWGNANWSFVGDVYQTSTFVELRVPFVDIGSPSSVNLVLAMINEQGGGEWTYAAVPSSAFADGQDPDYAKYLQLDVQGVVAPNASPIK